MDAVVTQDRQGGDMRAGTRREVTFWPNDRINPYLRLITAGFADHGFGVRYWTPGEPAPRRGVLHLHWIEALAASRFASRSVAVAHFVFWRMLRHIRRVKRRGGALVLTAHNLRPHEAGTGRRARMLRGWLARIYAEVDAVVCMTHASAAMVAEHYPHFAGRTHVFRHPDYRREYADAPADAGVYRALDLPAHAVRLVMPGLMRPYKQIERTISVFRQIARDDEVLVIAGPCFVPGLPETLATLVGDDPRIRLRVAELSTAEYAELVREADITLVLQADLLNSGSIIAALSLGTPAIAIDGPPTRETAAVMGERSIALIDALEPAALRAAIDMVRTWPPVAPRLDEFAPAHIAAQHIRLYRQLLDRAATGESA